MATDSELRGLVLAVTYDLRHANAGWVPISAETFGGVADVHAQTIRTICDHLQEGGLIEWRLRDRGVAAGDAKITGFGVDVVEGAEQPKLKITFPNRSRSLASPDSRGSAGAFSASSFASHAFQTAPETRSVTDPAISPGRRISFRGDIYRTERTHPKVAALHEELLSRVEALEAIVATTRAPDIPGIGHNQPPEPVEGISFGENEWREIEGAIRTLKEQPASPNDTTDAERAADILQSIGRSLWIALAYAAKRTDRVLDAAADEVGRRIIQMPFWWALSSALYAVPDAVHAWLAGLPH